jgi:hypothetical protein
MGHSIGDGIIVAAIAAAVFGYYYLKYLERRRRLEIIHRERLAAMEKGIPLPELPIDPPQVKRPPDPRAILLHGIVWTALGGGAMIGFRFSESELRQLWPLPMPLVLLGIGLMLYYLLGEEQPVRTLRANDGHR